MRLKFSFKRASGALILLASFVWCSALLAQDPPQTQVLTPNALSLSNVQFTRVQNNGRSVLHVEADIKNTSSHVIGGAQAIAHVWGDRPAPIERIFLREIGPVIAGGLLPEETLTVGVDLRLDARANAFTKDVSKLRLVLDVQDLLDEAGYSLLCVKDIGGLRGTKGPSPHLCKTD